MGAARFSVCAHGASFPESMRTQERKAMGEGFVCCEGREQSLCLHVQLRRGLLVFLYFSCSVGGMKRGLMPDGARPALYGMSEGMRDEEKRNPEARSQEPEEKKIC
jgi:hypothetical protein